jgi:hypothetical protein
MSRDVMIAYIPIGCRQMPWACFSRATLFVVTMHTHDKARRRRSNDGPCLEGGVRALARGDESPRLEVDDVQGG